MLRTTMDATFPLDYSPIYERDFDLPNDENVAIWIVINVEHDLPDESVSTAIKQTTTDFRPDVFNFAWRSYGNRVGIWRLIDLLDRYDLPATLSLNSMVCDHEPQIVDAALEREWAIMGHGRTNSQLLAGMTPETERAVLRETRQDIEAYTGHSPSGWLSPGLTETFNTLDLLAETGYSYVADWCNDDQPYVMDVDHGDLIALPYSVELNDVSLFTRFDFTPDQYEQILLDNFDVVYQEGNESGNAKVMAIPLHPFLVGQPFRIGALERILEYCASHEDVWFTTGDELADYYRRNYC